MLQRKNEFYCHRKKNLQMKVLFLGDIVGPSGCAAVKKYLKKVKLLPVFKFYLTNLEI